MMGKADNSAYTQKLAGFAFSFGDALLQLDKKGAITLGFGGVHDLFAETEQSIAGKCLNEFLSESDRASVRDYLTLLRDNKRPNPIELKINRDDRDPVSVLLSGIFIEQIDDAYFLAFRRTYSAKPAPDISGSWRKPDDSEDFAQRMLALNQSRGKEDASLSIFQLQAFEPLQATLGENERQMLEQAILSLFKNSAIAEDAVTGLGDGRYGVMHDDSVDLESLKGDVVQTARGFDDSGRDLKVDAASLAFSLFGQQPNSVEALAGALRQIASHPSGSVKIFDNANALQGLINEARDDYNMVERQLSEKNFNLVFQPIVDLESRVVHHFEVLTRVGDSKESPFAFICAAENSGLIKDFDFLICEKVAAWKTDAANPMAATDLAVNLSALSVQDEAFVADLLRLTASLGDLQPSLHFEITETGTIESVAGINTVIQALRERGHKVYLDDFGAGQTSLQQLRKWDIDAVKIDGSYIRDALSEVSTRHVIRAIASLCNDLAIDCVAEMIENEETTQYLIKSGIKYGQGYLFGKPTEDISSTSSRPLIAAD